jgi:hypothetical protein
MLVFLMGAIMAVISLILARNIPIQPRAGCEVLWGATGSTESNFQ